MTILPSAPARGVRKAESTSPASRQICWVPSVVVSPLLNEPRDDVLVAGDRPQRAVTVDVPPTDEQLMGRALKLGVLLGIPSVFLVTGGIAYLGGTGLGPAAMVGAWCACFGNGPYLGGIFFLPRGRGPSEWPPGDTGWVTQSHSGTTRDGDGNEPLRTGHAA